MDRVNRGEWPWTTVDAIYRQRLDEVLRAAGIAEREIERLLRAGVIAQA